MPLNVVLEKGHGAGKKGMALEKKGMVLHHAKTGSGKHYLHLITFDYNLSSIETFWPINFDDWLWKVQ